jgi:electron transfer flavoprotein beta subunit
VITVDLRLNEPRYASLPSIMKARKKPVQKMNVEQLGIELEPRVELLALETVTAARSCHKVGSAQELLAVLQDDAKLI